MKVLKFFLYLVLCALPLVGHLLECQNQDKNVTNININRFCYSNDNGFINHIIERHYAQISLKCFNSYSCSKSKRRKHRFNFNSSKDSNDSKIYRKGKSKIKSKECIDCKKNDLHKDRYKSSHKNLGLSLGDYVENFIVSLGNYIVKFIVSLGNCIVKLDLVAKLVARPVVSIAKTVKIWAQADADANC